MQESVKKWLAGFALGGILLLVLDIFLLEHIFFSIKRFRIGRSDRRGQCIKILHLSDLHFAGSLSWKYRKLAKRVNAINPDIIFFSGDAIDKDGHLEPLEKFLRLLKYRIPKVAIPGNHEYLAELDFDKLKSVYQLVNGHLLVNESRAYKIRGKRLMVTGLDDLLEGEENFKKAVEDVGHEPNHFVLIHSPKHQEKILEQIDRLNNLRSKEDQLNIYAMFAGHNHGGQVKIGNYVPHLPPMSGDYIEGWFNEEKPYLYLSRGFGTSRVPVRMGARAEITLFEYFV